MTVHVFTTSQCIHVWAQNTQDSGRNGKGTVYFENGKLYSYGSHFVIGRHITMPDGSAAVLLNSSHYSISTSRHQSYARSAVDHLPRYYVSHPGDSIKDELRRASGELKTALEFVGEAKNKRSRAKRVDAVVGIVSHANALAEAFGLSDRLALPDDIEGWLAADKARALAEKAAAVRKAKVAERKWVKEHQADIDAWCRGASVRWYSGYAPADFVAHLTPAQIKTRGETEEAAAAIWKAGAGKDPVWGARANIPARTLLRLASDGAEVETSQGARFPVEHAKRVWRILSRLKVTPGALPWAKNGHSIPLGHFTIDAVDEAGTVKAGCHVVEWREVEDMAIRLGLVSRDTSKAGD